MVLRADWRPCALVHTQTFSSSDNRHLSECGKDGIASAACTESASRRRHIRQRPGNIVPGRTRTSNQTVMARRARARDRAAPRARVEGAKSHCQFQRPRVNALTPNRCSVAEVEALIASAGRAQSPRRASRGSRRVSVDGRVEGVPRGGIRSPIHTSPSIRRHRKTARSRYGIVSIRHPRAGGGTSASASSPARMASHDERGVM